KEAEKLARENQSKAEHQARRANAVSDFMTSMFISARPSKYGRAFDTRVIDLLQDAADSMDLKLRDQPEAEVEVRVTLGATYSRLGMGTEARTQLTRAYEAVCAYEGEESPEALRIASQLISMMESQPAEAEAMARKCYEIARRKLGEDDP